MENGNVIELTNLTKAFGAHLAVGGLDLAVPAGEIFGLLGHNGAGKSTTIGMMLGQVWPTSGEVKVCGQDVTTHRARALQKVGAIFESPAFYDYLSAYRNLEIEEGQYPEITYTENVLGEDFDDEYSRMAAHVEELQGLTEFDGED